jgi:hypothetical protein
MIELTRSCDGCDVCCTVAGVPDMAKAPYEKCKYQCNGCGIFGQEDRPQVCNSFECSWLRGFGGYGDRPDNIGVMFAINSTDSGHIHFAIEVEPNAIMSTGKDMAVRCAEAVPLPIIVSKHNSYPNDRGDYIVLHDKLKDSWKRNTGDVIEKFSDEVSIYNLKF